MYLGHRIKMLANRATLWLKSQLQEHVARMPFTMNENNVMFPRIAYPLHILLLISVGRFVQLFCVFYQYRK